MDLKFTPLNMSLQDHSEADNDPEKMQSLKGMRYSNTESKETDLVLKTKQGDFVTLSKSSDFETELNTYSALRKTQNSASSSSVLAFKAEYSNSYDISLEGDFNKEEIKDINKAIKSLEKAMKSLVSGNTDKALKNAMSLTGLDTVAGFEANLSYSFSREYEYAESLVEEYTQKPVKSLYDSANNFKPVLEKLTEETADKTKASEIPEYKVSSVIDKLFEDMKEELKKADEDTAQNPWDDFFNSLKDRFDQRLFDKA
ncbi:MAG: hypothetical protein ACQEQS_07915 [Thermodesulfobacteriota bacterium]